jgi:hypothetical protein
VVQTVRSTAQGNYRFKSVAAGSYRLDLEWASLNAGRRTTDF